MSRTPPSLAVSMREGVLLLLRLRLRLLLLLLLLLLNQRFPLQLNPWPPCLHLRPLGVAAPWSSSSQMTPHSSLGFTSGTRSPMDALPQCNMRRAATTAREGQCIWPMH